MSKLKDWLVVWDAKKEDYFAIPDKHEGITPKTIGGNKVVGIVSFKHPADAIDYIRFIESVHPMKRRK